MLGWGRKRDGFEWREYVRTTILVRRKKRADKLDAFKDAAVDKLKEAGRRGSAASADGARSAQRAFSAAAGTASGGVMALLRQFFDMVARGAAATWQWVSRHVLALLGWLRRLPSGWPSGPGLPSLARSVNPGGLLRQSWRGLAGIGGAVWSLRSTLTRFASAGPLILMTGWAITGAGLARCFLNAVDTTAIGLVGVGGLLVVASILDWGWVWRRLASLGRHVNAKVADLMPERPMPSVSFLKTAAGSVAAALIGAAAYSFALPSQTGLASLVSLPKAPELALPAMPSLPGLPDFRSLNPFAGGDADVLEGRARAETGDTLRIGKTIIKLAGVDAPEPGQTCRRPGSRRWRCGVTAEWKLGRLIRRKSVTCTLTGDMDLGVPLATCKTKDMDIAAELVRGGYVFAQGGFLTSRYGALEDEAQRRKRGIWRGKPDRPEDYRRKLWAQAVKGAPEGCPIKGRAHSRRGKIYVVPWSVSYGRYRVRESRGDRWFCSEEEAVRAGWRPLEHS